LPFSGSLITTYNYIAEDLSLCFHLEHQQKELSTLRIHWKKAMGVLPSLGTELPWPHVGSTQWQFMDYDIEYDRDVAMGGEEEWSDGEDPIYPQHNGPTESEEVNLIDVMDGGRDIGGQVS
jgi:hypothetical protein